MCGVGAASAMVTGAIGGPPLTGGIFKAAVGFGIGYFVNNYISEKDNKFDRAVQGSLERSLITGYISTVLDTFGQKGLAKGVGLGLGYLWDPDIKNKLQVCLFHVLVVKLQVCLFHVLVVNTVCFVITLYIIFA